MTAPDAVEISQLAQAPYLPAEAGAVLPAAGVLRLFLGHAIKWAPTVAYYRARSAAADSAVDFAEAFHGAVVFSQGRRWPQVFKSMRSSPGVHFTSGLVHNAQCLGLIRPLPAAARAPGEPRAVSAGAAAGADSTEPGPAADPGSAAGGPAATAGESAAAAGEPAAAAVPPLASPRPLPFPLPLPASPAWRLGGGW